MYLNLPPTTQPQSSSLDIKLSPLPPQYPNHSSLAPHTVSPAPHTNPHYQQMQSRMLSLAQMQAMNLELWDRVHKMEFLIEQEVGKGKRDERRFKRKLTRMAKYIEMRKVVMGGSDTRRELKALGKRMNELERAGRQQADERLVMPDINTIMAKRRQRKTANKEDPEATETDSDYEDMKLTRVKTGEQRYLDEYVTLGELSGKIPPSLLVNINFERFAQDNDFPLIGYDGADAAAKTGAQAK